MMSESQTLTPTILHLISSPTNSTKNPGLVLHNDLILLFFFYIFILNSIQFNSIHAPDHIASLSLKSGPHHVDGGQRVNSDVGLHKKSHFFFLI
jgi:hypothetical protein